MTLLPVLLLIQEFIKKFVERAYSTVHWGVDCYAVHVRFITQNIIALKAFVLKQTSHFLP